LRRASGHRRLRRQLRAQRAAGQGGRLGKDARKRCPRREAVQECRRNGNRRNLGGGGFLSSRHRKLEQRRIAAGGSRRGYRGQEGGWSRLRREDFEGRAQRRANGIYPILNRRSSVNRSSCGRRTSLGAGAVQERTPRGAIYIYRFNAHDLASRVPHLPLRRYRSDFDPKRIKRVNWEGKQRIAASK